MLQTNDIGCDDTSPAADEPSSEKYYVYIGHVYEAGSIYSELLEAVSCGGRGCLRRNRWAADQLKIMLDCFDGRMGGEF